MTAPYQRIFNMRKRSSRVVRNSLAIIATLSCVIARNLGMQLGMDVARGPEETSVYLTVGSAW